MRYLWPGRESPRQGKRGELCELFEPKRNAKLARGYGVSCTDSNHRNEVLEQPKNLEAHWLEHQDTWDGMGHHNAYPTPTGCGPFVTGAPHAKIMLAMLVAGPGKHMSRP